MLGTSRPSATSFVALGRPEETKGIPAGPHYWTSVITFTANWGASQRKLGITRAQVPINAVTGNLHTTEWTIDLRTALDMLSAVAKEFALNRCP
jgi:hypothetical protein